MVKQCLSAGWGPITYRQNTELSIGAWHWNPNAAWSDAANKRGYFTGSADVTEAIRYSYGYPLPHRGHTRNGGAERGYSRLTDGNPDTFWKSNPYLAGKFTGQTDTAHPQWVVIDLGSREPVSHIRVDWGEPYASAFEMQCWAAEKSGEENPMERPTSGVWTAFPDGIFKHGKGGSVLLQLASTPIATRFLRIWMTESSNSADSGPMPCTIRKIRVARRDTPSAKFTSERLIRAANWSISSSIVRTRLRLRPIVPRSTTGIRNLTSIQLPRREYEVCISRGPPASRCRAVL